MPSGNAIATIALQQLGLLLANSHYLFAAENSLKASYEQLQTQAITHCTQLHALENFLHPCKIIILRGDVTTLRHWQQSIHQNYTSDILSFIIPPDTELPESLKGKDFYGQNCAYICEGTHCLPPVTELPELISYINNK